MPSPFPGMDPFIEAQFWTDFHSEYLGGIRAALAPKLLPKYIVRLEQRVYFEHPVEETAKQISADIGIIKETHQSYGSDSDTGTILTVPIQMSLPNAPKVKEIFCEIRDHNSRELITVIELLSPSNKRANSSGRKEYLDKRIELIASETHLIELDFLRGGLRLPMETALPSADYYVIVSQWQQRPLADVWHFTLKNRLPKISVPLANDDPEIELDLQAIFDAAYERAAYHAMLDYGQPVEPPLTEEQTDWVKEILKNRQV